MANIIQYILSTDAIKLCKSKKPFWTKKGTLIPYKIDTNLLFGDTSDAIELLDFIQLSSEQTNRLSMPRNIFIRVLKQYNTNKKYRAIINNCVNYINTTIGSSRIDYIAGIEENDWFFSLIIAYLLKKPHISIFKNKECLVTNSYFTNTFYVDNFENARVLNITSILNNTNKITKLLIPIGKNSNFDVCWNFSVINTLKNSFIKLNELNIEDYSLTTIKQINKFAYQENLISSKTYALINNFIINPHMTMKNFLLSNPEFINISLSESIESAKAATICTTLDVYKLASNSNKNIKLPNKKMDSLVKSNSKNISKPKVNIELEKPIIKKHEIDLHKKNENLICESKLNKIKELNRKKAQKESAIKNIEQNSTDNLVKRNTKLNENTNHKLKLMQKKIQELENTVKESKIAEQKAKKLAQKQILKAKQERLALKQAHNIQKRHNVSLQQEEQPIKSNRVTIIMPETFADNENEVKEKKYIKQQEKEINIIQANKTQKNIKNVITKTSKIKQPILEITNTNSINQVPKVSTNTLDTIIISADKKTRGRPRKLPIENKEDININNDVENNTNFISTHKKTRGRPRKLPIENKVDINISNDVENNTNIISTHKKTRGRPRKLPIENKADINVNNEIENNKNIICIHKKTRGRPRKLPIENKTDINVNNEIENNKNIISTHKKTRGRPRKLPIENKTDINVNNEIENNENIISTHKKTRGRPRKSPIENNEVTTSDIVITQKKNSEEPKNLIDNNSYLNTNTIVKKKSRERPRKNINIKSEDNNNTKSIDNYIEPISSKISENSFQDNTNNVTNDVKISNIIKEEKQNSKIEINNKNEINTSIKPSKAKKEYKILKEGIEPIDSNKKLEIKNQPKELILSKKKITSYKTLIINNYNDISFLDNLPDLNTKKRKITSYKTIKINNKYNDISFLDNLPDLNTKKRKITSYKTINYHKNHNDTSFLNDLSDLSTKKRKITSYKTINYHKNHNDTSFSDNLSNLNNKKKKITSYKTLIVKPIIKKENIIKKDIHFLKDLFNKFTNKKAKRIIKSYTSHINFNTTKTINMNLLPQKIIKSYKTIIIKNNIIIKKKKRKITSCRTFYSFENLDETNFIEKPKRKITSYKTFYSFENSDETKNTKKAKRKITSYRTFYSYDDNDISNPETIEPNDIIDTQYKKRIVKSYKTIKLWKPKKKIKSFKTIKLWKPKKKIKSFKTIKLWKPKKKIKSYKTIIIKKEPDYSDFKNIEITTDIALEFNE